MEYNALCIQCKKEILSSLEICPFCGAKQDVIVMNLCGEKSKIIAILLALFFGSIGVHLFYLKQKLLGALYLTVTIVSLILFIYARIILADMDVPENVSPIFLLMSLQLSILLFIIVRVFAFIDMIKYIMISDRAFTEKYG